MGLFWKEGRGPAWKRGWTEKTLASMSPPPLYLLAIFVIIFILLYVSSYATYKTQMQQTVLNFKLLLLFLPVLLILLAQVFYKFERFVYPPTKAEHPRVDNRSFDFPWGVAFLVVLLLVMVSYHSSCQSMWSPLVRNSD